MNIQSINSLPAGLPATQSTTAIEKSTGDGFSSLVKNAVESIDSTQKQADEEIAKAVTGESPDIHKTIIALQTADLKFQLGLQVRNKLIGAYEEVMRMQV
jgi:flagellar hook-basal body complex protein FliE